MTKLCVALTEKDTESMLAAMHSLPAQVDLVEVRVDAMGSVDLERLIDGRGRPVIVTNRPPRQGGACTDPETERLAGLRRAAELGAEYVDVELDAVADLGELPGPTQRIVSVHDFEATPSDLPALLDRILQTGPDVAKVVTTAHDIMDAVPVLELLRTNTSGAPLIALSMGEEGLVTRVLAGKFGAFLTFASHAAGMESAPGQVAVDRMLGMYRFPQIGPGTAVYGVIANPVAHSMSPAIHNAAFAALGLDAVYVPLKVTDCAAFLDAFERCDLRGLSVTIPHKVTMLGLMDEVEDLARRIGAVNTVDVRDGRRYGCNTDVSAAVGAIESAARRAGMETLRGRSVVLVGAGGAGRAIAYGLADKGADLTIANRTVEKAERLAAELGVRACGLDALPDLAADVLVNSTSVGMWPNVDASPVPTGMLREGMVVFDAVYNPMRTRLLREAEEAGAVTAPGVEWFVSQAAAQFELWTGVDAPREVMEQVLRSRLTGE